MKMPAKTVPYKFYIVAFNRAYQSIVQQIPDISATKLRSNAHNQYVNLW